MIIKKSAFVKPVSEIEFGMNGTENLNKFFDVLDIKGYYYRQTLTLSLISYLFPDISTPILYLYGDGGSSKTSILSYIKSVLDPYEPLDIRSNIEILPKLLDRMGTAHFDNFSNLSSQLQDKFCLTYSGGSSSFIKKYTDDEILNYNFKCPLMLSSVKVPHNMKNDFYSRVTFLKINKHEQIKTDHEIEQKLNELYPYVRGELFSLASKILPIYNNFSPTNLTRHASFETLGKAYFSIIGKSEEEYINFTKTKISNDASIYITSDVVLTTFIDIVLKKEFKFFTAYEIKDEIEEIIDDDYVTLDTHTVGKKITQIKDRLSEIGIKLYPGKKTNPARPYFAVTDNYLKNHPDIDSSLLDNKEYINQLYYEYKADIENIAVDDVINEMIN